MSLQCSPPTASAQWKSHRPGWLSLLRTAPDLQSCGVLTAMPDAALQILLWLLAGLLIVLGLAGLILPVLPGIPLMYAGLVLLAWAGDFVHVGWVTLALLGVLTVLSYGIDFLATALGAKKFGASPRAAVGAAVGGVVGLFFGLPGILIGPLLGAVLGEFSRKATLQQATQAGVGATLGLLFGALLKLALAFTMLGVFALAWVI